MSSSRQAAITPRSLAAILNPDVNRPSVPEGTSAVSVPPLPGQQSKSWASLRHRVYEGRGEMELLLFRAGSENFAVPLDSIQEALDCRDRFTLPDMPAHVNAILNMEDRSIPVYDSRAFLGVECISQKPSVLIVKGSAEHAALLVDELRGSLKGDLSVVRNVAALEDAQGAFVGVFFHEGELFTLLDPAAFIRQSASAGNTAAENPTTEDCRGSRGVAT